MSKDDSQIHLTQPLRCIVKMGGAAVTCKNKFEIINEENLKMVSVHLRQAMVSEGNSYMDWSKRPGHSAIACPNVDAYENGSTVDNRNFIVIHGAGSFGHFQASKSGVHKGGLDKPLVKAGFVATRISVTSLNLEIVRALAREGIPSVAMSPFSCGWSTCQRQIVSADTSAVTEAINSGFIPVLHGDAVFDSSLGCTILSGDVIIRHFAEKMKPEFVVFLTDVLGVYDRPPSEPGAILLKEIAVHEDGSWQVIEPKLGNGKQVEMSVAKHDTTGGMELKIAEAAAIAKLGIDVYIVKAATDHSVKALRGELLQCAIPTDWLGTAIRYTRKAIDRHQ